MLPSKCILVLKAIVVCHKVHPCLRLTFFEGFENVSSVILPLDCPFGVRKVRVSIFRPGPLDLIMNPIFHHSIDFASLLESHFLLQGFIWVDYLDLHLILFIPHLFSLNIVIKLTNALKHNRLFRYRCRFIHRDLIDDIKGHLR